MITLYTVPTLAAVIPEETVEPQTGDPGYMQPLTSYETEHTYDDGIIDGGVYNLRNVCHNAQIK